MAREFNGKYEYDENGINDIISEKGDLFLALREVRWSENKEFKLDLRHYKSTEEGDIPLKGCSFTDDDADGLVTVLLEEGFGDDHELAESITSLRPNLCNIIKNEIYSDAEMSDIDSRSVLFEKRGIEEPKKELSDDDDYYDPRDLLVG